MSVWTTVVGLEVHAQLSTRTKLFCGCEARFGAEPNSLVCPVCSGQPGALPVLNAEALNLALRAALALGCEIAPRSKFDRKNYFYPDLPKGYQITQYDAPYCQGGGITLASGKRVRLTRIHMEEDAGKTIHDRGTSSLVDLNRAGVPLIESVTEPDIESADDAVEYLGALKEILEYSGVSACDMEKGSLRCDVNISVHLPGEPLRTKVELKNLNSFRHVHAAIEHEVGRQQAAYEAGEKVAQETRLWDPERGVTRLMRSKENESDYRYFPEPDLPWVRVEAATLEALGGHLPQLPAARRARYTAELDLSEYDAGVLTAERGVSDFFEAVVRAGAPARDASKWIQNELLRALSDPEIDVQSVDQIALRPRQLARLIALVAEGAVGGGPARTVFDEVLLSGAEPEQVIDARGLRQVRDDAAIEAWCRAALEGKQAIIDEVRAGKDKALGALIGPVMAASKGSADPKLVRATLERLIEESA